MREVTNASILAAIKDLDQRLTDSLQEVSERLDVLTECLSRIQTDLSRPSQTSGEATKDDWL